VSAALAPPFPLFSADVLPYALAMTSEPRPDYLRTTLRKDVGPATGVGVVAAIIAAQEGAGVLGSVAVAIAITLVIMGMLVLKRRF